MDGEYVLAGRIELDEDCFSTEIPEKEKDNPLKRGREDSQRKSKVLLMAESEFVQSLKKWQKPRRVRYLKKKVIDTQALADFVGDSRVRYLKKKVIDTFKSRPFNEQVKTLAHSTTEIDTDDSTSYVGLKDFVPRHNAQVMPKEKVGEIFS